MRRATTVYLGLVLASGCIETLPIEPTGSALMLVGVVVEGADSAFVRIGTTSRDRELAPVAVSAMTLFFGDRTIPLDEAPDRSCGALEGLGCRAAALQSPVRPGDSVRVVATIADGRRVTGRASVPARPNLRLEGFPGDTAHLSALEDRVTLLGAVASEAHIALAHETAPATVWTAAGASQCRVSVRSYGPQFLVTTQVGVAEPECNGAPAVTWDSLSTAVTLHSYDANFTAWVRSDRIPPPEPGTFGVTGAHGVFGAAVARTFILIVRNGEPGG